MRAEERLQLGDRQRHELLPVVETMCVAPSIKYSSFGPENLSIALRLKWTVSASVPTIISRDQVDECIRVILREPVDAAAQPPVCRSGVLAARCAIVFVPATSEISRNTTVTAEQTRAITQAITEVAKSMTGTDQAACQVQEYSTAMRWRFEDMRREIRAFVARIRAA